MSGRVAVGVSSLTVRVANGVLAVPPLARFLKGRARDRIIRRAEAMGIPWRDTVAALRARDWSEAIARVENPDLTYPDYYLRPFHAYESGNLSWEAAFEAECASRSVHARAFGPDDLDGDRQLRQSYQDHLDAALHSAPRAILDLGCSIGLSTAVLHASYPDAKATAIDLSPYFLAVARDRLPEAPISWLHGAAEATGLPDASFDLVSACLVFHELPQTAARDIFREARRLLRPGGHFAMMEMNPESEVYAKLPPAVFALLKSTEPYLDDYFALDVAAELVAAGFEPPAIATNSLRHRTVVAAVAPPAAGMTSSPRP